MMLSPALAFSTQSFLPSNQIQRRRASQSLYATAQQSPESYEIRRSRSTSAFTQKKGASVSAFVKDKGSAKFNSNTATTTIRSNNRSKRADAALAHNWMTKQLLSHELLTKEQELRLGTAVQRARLLREALDAAAQNKKDKQVEIRQRQQQQQQAQPLEGGEDDDDDDDDDDMYLSIYGGADWYAEDLREEEWIHAQEERMRASHLANSRYMEQENRWSTLTEDELETVLGSSGGRNKVRRILRRGERARKILLESNVQLVANIASQYLRYAQELAQQSTDPSFQPPPSFDETLQEGMLGLNTAVDRYDPSREWRFATYATWWVTSAVQSCVRRQITSPLRIPLSLHNDRSKYNKLFKKYTSGGDDKPPPGLDALAKEMGVSEKRLRFVIKMTQSWSSLDRPVPGKVGEDGETVGETLRDTGIQAEEYIDRSFFRQSLENAMASELVPHERDILRFRYGLDGGGVMTTRQVAQEFGPKLTPNDVRMVEKKAFAKLRSSHCLTTYNLCDFFDMAGIDRATIKYALQ
jgi:RNA polymerase primary sigma factor